MVSKIKYQIKKLSFKTISFEYLNKCLNLTQEFSYNQNNYVNRHKNT